MRNGLDNFQGSFSLSLESEWSFQVSHEQSVPVMRPWRSVLELSGGNFTMLEFSLMVLDCPEDLTCDWLDGSPDDQSEDP